jgi:hypothetical protein
MKRAHVAIVVVTSAVVAGAGGALAASKLDSPTTRSQAIITDAAGQLNIDPTKLTGALQKAIDDQIDAAVQAGKLTPDQGAALKKRVDSGQVPLVGGLGLGARGLGHGKFGPRGFGFGFGHDVLGAAADAVATYLAITPAELRTELESGKTLAQIATAHNKTAGGVVTILLDQAKQKLDKAVTAGFLTAAKEQTALAHLKSLLTDVVNGTLPKPPAGAPSLHPGFGFARPGGFGTGPPPPPAATAPASL